MTRVLVVDDESGIRSLLAALLEDEGYEVVTAVDGPSAVTMAERHQPDLILLDVMMPGMNGRDVERRLREQEAFAETPIIFMSAVGNLRPEPTALTTFVDKPFDIDSVLTQVERFAGSKS